MEKEYSNNEGAVKSRKRYKDNPEYCKEWKRNWIAENPEQYKLNRIKWRSSPSSRCSEMLAASRGRAKRKGLEINITKDWLLPKLENGICELSGLSFDLTPLPEGRQNPFTASLDRIDCSKGYTMDNVRVIVWGLNAAFNTYGSEVYEKIAKAYFQHQQKTGLT